MAPLITRIPSISRRFSPIGLDVGSAAVRAAQLRFAGGRWRATTLSHWPIAQQDAKGLDSVARSRLAQWLRDAHFRGRGTIIGLSPPDVEIHAMELPRVENAEPEELRSAARLEIERLMSFSSAEAEVDLWHIPPSKVARTTAIGVAARKDSVAGLLDICQRANLDCMSVDATACALARFGWVVRGLGDTANDVWGVLDLGGRLSRLILCVDRVPVLARALEYGGQSWTRRLAESLKVSERTAEQHKRDHGIARIARHRDQNGDSKLGEMIYNVLRRDLDGMIEEIERSYQYVLRCYAPRQPGPLLLVGGGAETRNLTEMLTERLGIDVRVPFIDDELNLGGIDCTQVAGKLREPIHSYASAIGLALASEATDGQR